MAKMTFTKYTVGFHVSLPPYTPGDAGSRATMHSARWDRLDTLYWLAHERLQNALDEGMEDIARDESWSVRVAHRHRRVVRLRAAMDREEANDVELVYPGPRRLGRHGGWTFADYGALTGYWRMIQDQFLFGAAAS